MLRGHELKRYVRAAAALQELYNDADIGRVVGLSRITVGKWWEGASPKPDSLSLLASATGLSWEELSAFVYRNGPPPKIVWPGSPTEEGVREGTRPDPGGRPT